ncbi:MAG: S1/P1 nuclease [Flavisolibacter sp.]|nr:S1/P1 nuclease [Flavisolibacter sp.]
MNNRFFKILVLSLCFYCPLQSFAWGMYGHRIVGEIAESYLSKKAKKEIRKILGNESLAMASNWADFIKSDTSYRYLDTWHYVNFKKGLNCADFSAVLSVDTSVNAYTKINFLAGELKRQTLTNETKQMYLRLLIHFVGDIHQPLHVSPEGTTGGNDIKVTWFSQASNLHRVWDSHLVEYQQLSYTEHVKAINHTTRAQRDLLQNQPLCEWLFESYTLAQVLHDEITTPNPRLGYEYNFKHVATMNDQLLKGGVRLAGMLNEIFR